MVSRIRLRNSPCDNIPSGAELRDSSFCLDLRALAGVLNIGGSESSLGSINVKLSIARPKRKLNQTTEIKLAQSPIELSAFNLREHDVYSLLFR